MDRPIEGMNTVEPLIDDTLSWQLYDYGLTLIQRIHCSLFYAHCTEIALLSFINIVCKWS